MLKTIEGLKITSVINDTTLLLEDGRVVTFNYEDLNNAWCSNFQTTYSIFDTLEEYKLFSQS